MYFVLIVDVECLRRVSCRLDGLSVWSAAGRSAAWQGQRRRCYFGARADKTSEGRATTRFQT